MLEKNYNPKDFEEKIYSDWERDNDFKPDMRSDKDAFASLFRRLTLPVSSIWDMLLTIPCRIF